MILLVSRSRLRPFTPTRNAIGLSPPVEPSSAVADGRLSPWRSILPPQGGGKLSGGTMKLLPPGLAAHLASGATTLAWCWRLTRRDGTAQGFTDHDRDIVFDGTTFEAAAGFTASEIKDAVGLSVDNLEVESALSSERLERAGPRRRSLRRRPRRDLPRQLAGAGGARADARGQPRRGAPRRPRLRRRGARACPLSPAAEGSPLSVRLRRRSR